LRVLVVDDDPDIAEAVAAVVSVSWPDAEIIEAADGSSAIFHAGEVEPDIVVLDVGLPDMTGFAVMQAIRETSEVPIVMLTARDGHMDKVEGLEFGADDYITKPFAPMELLARIRAVLRRTQRGAEMSDQEPFEEDGLLFDFAAHEVIYRGEKVPLTPLEYKLLAQFVQGYPRVVPHENLLRSVWGPTYVGESDYLKVHVQRIRSKFGNLSPGFDPIANERGVGYRLNLSHER
jgi:two-component system, OmpR family, KDP operon response regulator KdpE